MDVEAMHAGATLYLTKDEINPPLLERSRVTTRMGEFMPVHLDRVAEEVVSDLEALVRTSGGQVIVDPLPVVLGDALQMRQLLQNLIGNALKFQREGAVPMVRVTGEAVEGEKGSQVKIVVADNGIGFQEKSENQIFQPFVRLHGRSQYEGNGMGLAICRKIVKQHGGTISAHSEPGVGSRFTILLPGIE